MGNWLTQVRLEKQSIWVCVIHKAECLCVNMFVCLLPVKSASLRSIPLIIIIIIIIIIQEKINVAFSPKWTSRTRYNVKKLT